MKKKVFILLTFLLIFSFAFIVGEIGLRLSGRLESWSEKNGKGYISSYNQTDSTWYHLRRPGNYTDKRKEFNYSLSINGDGLRDTVHQINKRSGIYRIMGLGDSFTEGFGASSDSTWLSQLSILLSRDTISKQVEFINAGVSGSDPFYSYILLKDKLVKYHPDLVVLTINKTDFDDFVCRGGEERFLASGKMKGKNSPKIEWFFKNSHLARLVMIKLLGYDWQLLNPKSREENYKQFLLAMKQLFGKYNELAKKENFRIYVVIHPLLDEVIQHKYFLEFDQLDKIIKTDSFPVIDLLPIFEQYLNRLNSRMTDIYWPIDKHNNAFGYSFFSQAIYLQMRKDSIDIYSK